jgi:hypothetical protein
MKGKFLFGTGLAAGFVLGSRSGRAAYEKLKTRAAGFWDSKPVQDKVAAATEVVKDKAPEISSQLTEAARRAGTVIGSAVHRNDATAGSGTDTPSSTEAGGSPAAGAVPAHSTHPETANLGTSGGPKTPKDSTTDADGGVIADLASDPALNDEVGQDWSDEGGATPAGPATKVDPDKH